LFSPTSVNHISVDSRVAGICCRIIFLGVSRNCLTDKPTISGRYFIFLASYNKNKIPKRRTNMQLYQEIATQPDVDQLLASINSFHDSMAKEIHVINRGCVLPDHVMAPRHQYDIQLLIQSQWPPYAIELVFINVHQFQLNRPQEYWEASGKVERISSPVEKTTIQIAFDHDALVISCERLFYRFRGEWLGYKTYLSSEIPSPEAIPAQNIDGTWRMCSECLNTWEDPANSSFSTCPRCGRVTELH
jgi:hypothetical protein